MSKKNKRICSLISIIFAISTIVEAVFMFNKYSIYVPIVIIVACTLLSIITVAGIYHNKPTVLKLGLVIGFFMAAGVGIYLGLEVSGILEMLKNENSLKEIIAKTGVWGPIVYIFIQFAQVTLVPIPSTVTIVAGTLVFDLVEVVLYSTIGLVLGSMFAFMLGKVFGVKLVVWILGAKPFNKYQKLIRGRDKTMLFLMFILPVFPDDLLCLIAGITTMSYTNFFLMQIITRPLGILFSSSITKLIESIPFTGWYLAIWALLAIMLIAMFVLVWKYSARLENAIVKFIVKHFNSNSEIGTIDRSKLKRHVKNLVSSTSVITENETQFNTIADELIKSKEKILVNYSDN